jgi:Zn-dependent protease
LFGSLDFGRVFGIPVRVSVLFLALILFAGMHAASQRPEALGLLAALILSLFAHELAHALMARRLGVQVIDITFMPHAGMARMRGLPEDPRVESFVALAGPVSNLILAALLWPVAALAPATSAVGLFAGAMVVVNLFLGLLNLLPAFPMDGGRVLRSLIALRRGWFSATEQAVSIGRGLALGLLVMGLLQFATGGSGWLGFSGLLIAAFLWIEGTKELWRVRLRWSGHPLGSLFGQSPASGAGPAAGGSAGFGGFGGLGGFGSAGPREARPAPPATGPAHGPAPSASQDGPRRPRQWEFELGEREAPPGARRLDDAALRRLEAYRGPLRRPATED